MTTPKRKKQLQAQKNVKEALKNPQSTVPIHNIEGKEVPPAVKKIEATIVGEYLKVVNRDPMNYVVAIDMVHIKEIKRVSYNVIMGQLMIVFPETTGRIGEQDIDIVNPTGHKTGGKRRELVGQITSFKTSLDDEGIIKRFLTIWMGVEELTEELFEGFKHHKMAQEVLAKASEMKKKEKEGNTSTILSPTGEPAKKD